MNTESFMTEKVISTFLGDKGSFVGVFEVRKMNKVDLPLLLIISLLERASKFLQPASTAFLIFNMILLSFMSSW